MEESLHLPVVGGGTILSLGGDISQVVEASRCPVLHLLIPSQADTLAA